jgi:hypothetical protein
MKLANTMVARALDQLDAKVIPDDHPANQELTREFGDHTFFLDQNGLNIVEIVELVDTESGEAAGVVINLATWSDVEQSSLEIHPPEITDVVVELGPQDQPKVN